MGENETSGTGMTRRLSVAVGSSGNVRVQVTVPPDGSWSEAVAELWRGVDAVKSDDAQRRAGAVRRDGPTRPSADTLVARAMRH